MFSFIHRDKTLVTSFDGGLDTWEAIVRTIRGNPKRFICVTTFGHRIAAACDNNTVAIYDSVTGMLGLTLSPADPVQAMGGSPDGSVLFCRHQEPSVTLWDIQTGGLIHTFVLRRNAEDITISLKGHYLAYVSSNCSVNILEVTKKVEGTAIESCSQVSHLCWVEPEEQLVFAEGTSLHILDVVSGEVLRSFTMEFLVDGAVYPHQLVAVVHSPESNRLVIVTSSGDKSAAGTIDPLGSAESEYKFRWAKLKSSHFAFSQATHELVCGADSPVLELFNTSTHRWRRFEHPAITGFVSPLPSGFATANGTGPDIQLLSLDGRHSSPRATGQGDLAPATHILDQGKMIAVLRPGCSVTLVGPAAASELLKISFPTLHTDLTPVPSPTRHTDLFPFPTWRAGLIPICASLKNRMAVFCFEKGGRAYLELWEFCDKFPKWTVGTEEPPLSIGGISPFGVRLVTFHGAGNQAHIHVRDAQDGQLQVQLPVEPPHFIKPLEIVFESEDRFHFHYDTYRIPYGLDLQECTLKIFCHGQRPLVERSSEGLYHVDDDMEWVVRGSKRVCWIPPGYIKSTQPSYSWAGSTLIMHGQDGTLRMLTFRR